MEPAWRGEVGTGLLAERLLRLPATRAPSRSAGGGGVSTRGIPPTPHPHPTPCPEDPVGRGGTVSLPRSEILQGSRGGGRRVSPLVTGLMTQGLGLQWVAQPPGPAVGSACCSGSGENMGAGSHPSTPAWTAGHPQGHSGEVSGTSTHVHLCGSDIRVRLLGPTCAPSAGSTGWTKTPRGLSHDNEGCCKPSVRVKGCFYLEPVWKPRHTIDRTSCRGLHCGF